MTSAVTIEDDQHQYSGYRFPPEIIQQAIRLYVRFTLSFRDVEDLLAERGIVVSYETVRRWVNHFGPMIAADLRKRRQAPYDLAFGRSLSENRWPHGLSLARRRRRGRSARCAGPETKRNKRAALKLMRKLSGEDIITSRNRALSDPAVNPAGASGAHRGARRHAAR